MSKALQFPVRRYRAHPMPGEPYDEHSFGHVEHLLDWRPEQTAVITVDLWNMAWLPEPLDPALGRYAEHSFMGVGKSLMQVMQQIETERIVPTLCAARDAGLTVIHSNMHQIALKHPDNAVIDEPTGTPEEDQAPDWPPRGLSDEWMADYTRHTWGEGAEALWDRMRELADFPPPLMPAPGDIVICRQQTVERLLAERGICNLVYLGFMLNMCLMRSAGGVMRMVAPYRSPGYRGVVLRDCTCATESHETVDALGVTKAWLYHIETTGVPTALSSDFIAACEGLE